MILQRLIKTKGLGYFWFDLCETENMETGKFWKSSSEQDLFGFFVLFWQKMIYNA